MTVFDGMVRVGFIALGIALLPLVILAARPILFLLATGEPTFDLLVAIAFSVILGAGMFVGVIALEQKLCPPQRVNKFLK